MVIIICATVLGVAFLVSVTVGITCCCLRKRRANETAAAAAADYENPTMRSGRESGYYDDLCEGKMDKGEI